MQGEAERGFSFPGFSLLGQQQGQVEIRGGIPGVEFQGVPQRLFGPGGLIQASINHSHIDPRQDGVGPEAGRRGK